MAHNNKAQLLILLQLLDDARNDIYLHIDKKSTELNTADFKNKLTNANLYCVPSMSVNWGAYSQVQCELLLLRTALEQENYRYLHLLSGSDLPLVSQNEFHDFFEEQNGKEFIDFQRSIIRDENLNRVKYYHLFQEKQGPNKSFYWFLNKSLVQIQKMIKINRLRGKNLVIQKGSQWFSITNDFARYILNKIELIEEIFKDSLCSDELVIQTILVNSPFKAHLYHTSLDDSISGNLRFTIWEDNHPKVLTEKDEKAIFNSNTLFARKFDLQRDSTIINIIMQKVKNN